MKAPVSAVIGVGTVGLSLAARLSGLGHRVIICDVDTARLDALRSGTCPWISDPQLQAQVNTCAATWTLVTPDQLDAQTAPSRHWALLAVCVGTAAPCPEARGAGAAFSPEIPGALRPHLTTLQARGASGPLIALRSTALPGTARHVHTQTSARVVAWPEFLRADHAWHDSLSPSRSVMGGLPADIRALRTLTGEHTMAYDLTWEEAELSKLAANALISLHLAGLHWLRDLGQAHLPHPGGAAHPDPDWLRAAGHDPRLGADSSGPAWQGRAHWGGHCLPKDLALLVQTARCWGESSPLIDAALLTQQTQRQADPGSAASEPARPGSAPEDPQEPARRWSPP